MNASLLATRNNKRRLELNSHNLAYYENLLQYIRSTLFKDETATEEVLLEMLEHLIEAQHDGKTAEDVFGKSPKQLADEVIATLPREKFSVTTLFTIEILSLLIGTYVVVMGIMNVFVQKDTIVHIGTTAIFTLILGGGFLLVVYTILYLLKLDAIHYTSKFAMLCGWGIITVYICTVAISFRKIPAIGQAFVVGPFILLAIGIGLLVISYAFKKIRVNL